MSIRLMAKAWELDIPTNEKMLLLALCDHANDDGICYPSYDRLQVKCSFASRSTISANLKRLEAKNIIKKKIRNQSTGGRKTTVYTIDLDAQSSTAELEPKVQMTIAQSSTAEPKPLENHQNIYKKQKGDKVLPVDIVDYYKTQISNKHRKIQENSSYALMMKHPKDLPAILKGLKNYPKPNEEKYVVSLPKFIKDKIYLDYQEEVLPEDDFVEVMGKRKKYSELNNEEMTWLQYMRENGYVATPA